MEELLKQIIDRLDKIDKKIWWTQGESINILAIRHLQLERELANTFLTANISWQNHPSVVNLRQEKKLMENE
jgi:hypothetical protein